MQCAPAIGPLERGVLRISHLGYHILFVPTKERARVKREIAASGYTIHGKALHEIEEGEEVFVAVVKSDNEEKLRAIAHCVMAT
jgi:hypothetical protein